MATVYLALDIKHDRRVALKVLLPEFGAVLGKEPLSRSNIEKTKPGTSVPGFVLGP